MNNQKGIVEDLTADVIGLEVLLRIYEKTYHNKTVEEITEREWREQREALRGIIKAAEWMKIEALQRIGGEFRW